MKARSITIAVFAFFASAQLSNADQTEGTKIPARLDCSALMPKRASDSAFVSQITVFYSRGELSADRLRIVGSGVEKFTGTIDPLGRIEMTAKYEDKQSWVYRLKGKLEEKGPTILRGDVEVTSGAVGRRNCSITFLLKPADLMVAFSR